MNKCKGISALSPNVSLCTKDTNQLQNVSEIDTESKILDDSVESSKIPESPSKNLYKVFDDTSVSEFKVETPLWSFVEAYCYLLYVPLSVGGPTMTYDNFIKQVRFIIFVANLSCFVWFDDVLKTNRLIC